MDQYLKDLETHFSKAKYWVGYITTQIADGTSVFVENKAKYKEALFVRAKPNSEATAKFKMDDTNVQAMIEAMHDEFENTPSYMHQIIDAATVLAPRLVENPSGIQLDMFLELVRSMGARREFQKSVFVADEILQKLRKGNNSADI